MTGEIATRDDIERALWRWSEWRADQRGVDEVLELVDRYRLSAGNATQAARDLLDHARREADHIVQSARDEVTAAQSAVQEIPERPSDDLSLVPRSVAPGDIYQDPDGVMWLRLGVPVTNALLLSQVTRKCRRCGHVKPIAAFNHDRNSRDARKATCKVCESVGRRARGKGKQ